MANENKEEAVVSLADMETLFRLVVKNRPKAALSSAWMILHVREEPKKITDIYKLRGGSAMCCGHSHWISIIDAIYPDVLETECAKDGRVYCQFVRWKKTPFRTVAADSFEGALAREIFEMCRLYTVEFGKASSIAALVLIAVYAYKISWSSDICSFVTGEPVRSGGDTDYTKFPAILKAIRNLSSLGLLHRIKIDGHSSTLVTPAGAVI